MSIRKRIWKSGSKAKTAWVVDYNDQGGARRIKTFKTRLGAETWAISAGHEIEQSVPTVADDILRGASEIGDYIGLPLRSTYYALERGHIPAGKLGATWIASRRTLNAYLARISSGLP